MSKNVNELISKLSILVDQLKQIPNPDEVKLREFHLESGGYSEPLLITDFDLGVDLFAERGDTVACINVVILTN